MQMNKNIFLFVTYIIIQSITSSEMCSLHLTHSSTHTHTQQWAADAAAPGEQSGVRCLAQGSHLSRGQFLPERRFEPTTSGYKSDALPIRPRPPPVLFETAPTGFIRVMGVVGSATQDLLKKNVSKEVCFLDVRER